ncbi:class I SAM-dependent methyltransferase [bacterium]|nr:class I SAM-dependent methyltransferase [bacterium]
MEKIRCNICETNEYENVLWPVASGSLVVCKRCGLYYANPRTTTSIENVRSGNTATELYEAKKLNYEGRISEFKYILGLINNQKVPSGKLLDIGCYEGFFLNEARCSGWECTGVEPNIGGSNFAIKNLKLDVRQCILEKAGFEDHSFDVITLLAVLEHIPDPKQTLIEVKRILKKDGLLVIYVPTVPFYLNIIKSKWRMFIGDHYFFFTDYSMENLLNVAGFKLGESRYIKKTFDLDTMLARIGDPWQPMNIGKAGVFLRRIAKAVRIDTIKMTLNLFDSKVYLASL